MKGSVDVNPLDDTIILRNIKFQADAIRAEMLATGGTVVNDVELNKALDRAAREHKAKTGKEPEQLFIEAIPATVFIPRKIKVSATWFNHKARTTNTYLYFAKPRVFHA